MELERDCELIFQTLQGSGAASDLTRVLVNRSPAQLASIRSRFQKHYEKSLEQSIKDSQSIDESMKKAALITVKDPVERDADTLREIFESPDKSHLKLRELLTTRSPSELKSAQGNAPVSP